MTAGGSDYSQAVRWYETFERNLSWTNIGEILGAGKEKEARKLGESIMIIDFNEIESMTAPGIAVAEGNVDHFFIASPPVMSY